MASWSAAAARKVSPAASRTRLPWFFRRFASLPMVVVLPTPLTPIIRITAGLSVRSRSVDPTSSISTRISRRQALTSSGSLILLAFTRSRRVSTASRVVSMPMSERMRFSSSSSKKSSSTEKKPEKMFSFLILSNNPMGNASCYLCSVPSSRSAWSRSSLSTRLTPCLSMVTPYKTSAASMVSRRWVMSRNWVSCAIVLR